MKKIFTLSLPFGAILFLAACTNSVSNVLSDSNSHSVYTTVDGFSQLKVSYRGTIRPSVDDREILSVSEDGFLKISKGNFLRKRRILIAPDNSGGLVRKYYDGWSEEDFEPEGAAWLAEILPDVVRQTELGLPHRLNRYFTQGGTEAVLEEVKRIKCDPVQAKYLEVLIEKNLKPTEVGQSLSLAADEIESDYYVAQLLKEINAGLKLHPEIARGYAEAVNSISSDYYASEVLSDILAESHLEPAERAYLLSLGGAIQSDYYLAEMLTKSLAHKRLDAQGIRNVLELSQHITSDYYAAQVLKATNKDYELVGEAMLLYDEALANISSDHYMAEVLKEVLKDDLASPELAVLLRTGGTEISSDHYLAEVLRTTLQRQKLQDEAFRAFLVALRSLGSQHYFDSVLSVLTDEHSFTPDQLQLFRQLIPEFRGELMLTAQN